MSSAYKEMLRSIQASNDRLLGKHTNRTIGKTRIERLTRNQVERRFKEKEHLWRG